MLRSLNIIPTYRAFEFNLCFYYTHCIGTNLINYLIANKQKIARDALVVCGNAAGEEYFLHYDPHSIVVF